MDRLKCFLVIISVIIVSFCGKAVIGSKQRCNKSPGENRKDQCLAESTESERCFYTAVVVEYAPVPIGVQAPTEAMLQNERKYEELMESTAEQNADIIVFPEYGVTTAGMPSHRTLSREYMIELPTYGTVPCDDINGNGSSNAEILHRLSCAARRSNLYAVINIGEFIPCDSYNDGDCPSDGGYHYNTNVVFDRNGSLIASYRKYHLYFEPQFDKPTLEYSTFSTDFGVEFGLFTCFDIIFAHPAVELVARKNIRNFVFPTAWVDELPFLTGIQAQSLWAHSNRVNLLSSRYHQPERGSMGSGIYSKDGALNYTFDPNSGTKLLISSVPLNDQCGTIPTKKNEKVLVPESKMERVGPTAYHMWLREDLKNYSSKVIHPNSSEDHLCHNDLLCCHIEFDLDSPDENTSGQFRLLAFEGKRTVAAKTDWFEWQVCAVVHCLNETLESCTEREETTSASYPKLNRLRISLQPLKMEYGEVASQPGLSLIDTRFNLIPQSLFEMTQWRDGESGISFVEATSKDNEGMRDVSVKTIGLIQKIYGGRF